MSKSKEEELGRAAMKGDLAVVKRLLGKGVNPNNYEFVSLHKYILFS